MKEIQLQGIIFSSKNIFEKDKLIEVFSPDLGKCKLLAKGANSKRFRYGGRIDITNYCHFVVFKGKSFNFIKSCDILRSFLKIRKDFNKISLAFYFFDIIRKTTMYNQPNNLLFQLILDSLSALEGENEAGFLMDRFHSLFLQREGLLHDKRVNISQKEFQEIFEDYSGKRIEKPVLI
ncbi:DNA repair protein RecO [Candidatus Margulisiibacteriota bacterium]